jgi:hypothetical protein
MNLNELGYVDGTGSGSCLMAGFYTNGFEPLGRTARKLVKFVKHNNGKGILRSFLTTVI